jgi:hypothetical protein
MYLRGPDKIISDFYNYWFNIYNYIYIIFYE